jgi:hypothetical protein
MKNLQHWIAYRFLITIASLMLFLPNMNGQSCYEIISDNTGIDMSPYQDELEAAACALRDAFPEEFQSQFKVYDFGFYLHNEVMQGGVNEIWTKVKYNASSESDYYLLFGRVFIASLNKNKIFIDIVLPESGIFQCIDDASPHHRPNLPLKYEAIANELLESNTETYIELAIMDSIINFITKLDECCHEENRTEMECDFQCMFNNKQIEYILDSEGLQFVNVDDILIDEPSYTFRTFNSIGYKVVFDNVTMSLDESLEILANELQTLSSGITINIYTFRGDLNCNNIIEVIYEFKSDVSDIGIIMGIVGNIGEPGRLWWSMISDDDNGEILGPVHQSDTCYYFNEKLFFDRMEYCNSGIRPRGVIQDNLPGIYDFVFADPVNFPRNLTTKIEEQYNHNDEPYMDRCILITKYIVYNQLNQVILTNDNKPKRGAFDVHPFAPWSLFFESFGFDAPFDYSAKSWILDRINYLFVTDDGINVLGTT